MENYKKETQMKTQKSKFKKGQMVSVTISRKLYIGQFKEMSQPWAGERPYAWVAFPSAAMSDGQLRLDEVEIALSRLTKV
jgi:hypothetical protein